VLARISCLALARFVGHLYVENEDLQMCHPLERADVLRVFSFYVGRDGDILV